MRGLRRQLSPAAQSAAAQSITERLLSQIFFQKAAQIAAYLPFDGEVDTSMLISTANNAGKTICLPVLINNGKDMKFAVYTPEQRLLINRFGIPEPAREERCYIAANQLDLVLTPLVAFDQSLNRVGMGAGYYDRCFSFLRHRKNWVKPRLIGLAYDFQCVPAIKTHDWDVPLSGVVTENTFYQSTISDKRKQN